MPAQRRTQRAQQAPLRDRDDGHVDHIISYIHI